MTKFIELTGLNAQSESKSFHVNIAFITSIERSLKDNETLIYLNGKSYYVVESIQEIKALIEQAEQENPYRTK